MRKKGKMIVEGLTAGYEKMAELPLFVNKNSGRAKLVCQPGHGAAKVEAPDTLGRRCHVVISLERSLENMSNVGRVIAGLAHREQDFPACQLFFPGRSGVDSMLAEKVAKGCELMIFMDVTPNTKDPIFAAEDYKKLLLEIWSSLRAEGVKFGPVVLPNYYKPITNRGDLWCPMGYYVAPGMSDPLEKTLPSGRRITVRIAPSDLEEFDLDPASYTPITFTQKVSSQKRTWRKNRDSWLVSLKELHQAFQASESVGSNEMAEDIRNNIESDFDKLRPVIHRFFEKIDFTPFNQHTIRSMIDCYPGKMGLLVKRLVALVKEDVYLRKQCVYQQGHRLVLQELSKEDIDFDLDSYIRLLQEELELDQSAKTVSDNNALIADLKRLSDILLSDESPEELDAIGFRNQKNGLFSLIKAYALFSEKTEEDEQLGGGADAEPSSDPEPVHAIVIETEELPADLRNQKIYRFKNDERSSWIMQDGKGKGNIQNPDSHRQWQVRFPLTLNPDNIDKACVALAKLRHEESDFPFFKIQILGKDFDIKNWLGAYSGADRDQAGKVLNVSIDYNTANSKYAFRSDQYMDFILKIWAALDASGVEFDRVCTPLGEKPVLCDDSRIWCPAFYSAWKPWRGDHGLLLQEEHNPENLPDPLNAYQPLANRLFAHKIKRLGIRADLYQGMALRDRIDCQKEEWNKATYQWWFDYRALLQASNAEQPSYVNDREKWPRMRNPDMNPIADTVERDSVLAQSKQEFKELLPLIKIVFPDANTDKLTTAIIDNMFASNPYAMQLLFRRFHHILREDKSLRPYCCYSADAMYHFNEYLPSKMGFHFDLGSCVRQLRFESLSLNNSLLATSKAKEIAACIALQNFMKRPSQSNFQQLQPYFDILRGKRLKKLFNTFLCRDLDARCIVLRPLQSVFSVWYQDITRRFVPDPTLGPSSHYKNR